ncbi:beta-ketoacyl synthase N-terminal-like domain-containing protein [Streptomyces griseofuscus]|uniref:beta-ketoacyl synthase N-terminal-like domain-containing protein n=1 Tax=Streptomyces griseofuscus TaxID=146922 RepID=UPI0036B00F01
MTPSPSTRRSSGSRRSRPGAWTRKQRILLHVVWEALEPAGIAPSSLAGSRTCVFVGQATAEYGEC